MKRRAANITTAGQVKVVVLYPLHAVRNLIIRPNFIYVNYLRLSVASLFKSATNLLCPNWYTRPVAVSCCFGAERQGGIEIEVRPLC